MPRGRDAEGRYGGERRRCRGTGWWASGASSVPEVRDCGVAILKEGIACRRYAIMVANFLHHQFRNKIESTIPK